MFLTLGLPRKSPSLPIVDGELHAIEICRNELQHLLSDDAREH
jgi:hypothetical protein